MNTQRSVRVLVVDDEPTICWAFKKMFKESGYECFTAASAEEGLQLAAEKLPDLVLLDVRLPAQDGLSALPEFSHVTNQAPVIVMTAFGDLETAVEAVKQGASDYLTKPFRLEEAQIACRKALGAGKGGYSGYRAPSKSLRQAKGKLVGVSAAMQLVFKQIAFVAASDLSVLITGASGTGKELVAAAIHEHSGRRDRPYLPVAPVAMSSELIESELFGHVRGAFTGAHQDRIGLFEAAEGGTILLDEIGDLPLGTQVKLLRVLEQREYCRVGEVKSRPCNVRILAATNTNLNEAVRQGRFREDLFFRLNGLQMHLPPLSARVDDIEPLCKYFLEQLEYPCLAVSEVLVQELATRPWHGNIRELRNATEQATVLARGRELVADDFPPPQSTDTKSEFQPGSSESSLLEAIEAWWTNSGMERTCETSTTEGDASSDEGLYQRFLSVVEPKLIQLAMAATKGNRSKAASLLGLHRATLREKLKSVGPQKISDS